MRRLILRRLAAAIPLVWLVLTLTFVVVHALPGNFSDLLISSHRTPKAQERISRCYGLDLPLWRQYLRWLHSAVRGDFGISFSYQRPVADVVWEAVPPTLLLTGSALAIDFSLGLALAITAVRRPNGVLDRLSTILSLGIYGMPSFWLAGLAILVFSLFLGWLPSSHMHSVGADSLSGLASLSDLLRHLVLPAACLGITGAAATARYLRASMLDLRHARFILAARARGLPERRILGCHVLRPALLPVATLVGLSLPALISGSVVIEAIFSWPGIGQVLWKAAVAQDVPVILAVTLLVTTAVIAGNLVADLLYAVVDPRARDQ